MDIFDLMRVFFQKKQDQMDQIEKNTATCIKQNEVIIKLLKSDPPVIEPSPIDPSPGRPHFVFPRAPMMGQPNALPVTIRGNTVQTSKAESVKLNYEPKSARIATTINGLTALIDDGVPLIQIKGVGMSGGVLSLTSRGTNDEGVTVIEPYDDDAVAPSILLNTCHGIFVRNFKKQPVDWHMTVNGACTNVANDGVEFVGRVTRTTQFAFNPPLKPAVMRNCFAQNHFAAYNKHSYDAVMVIFGVSVIGKEGEVVGGVENCGAINILALDHGEPVQAMAWKELGTHVMLSRLDMKNCFFRNIQAMATFAKGTASGNSGPEDAVDIKSKADDPSQPLTVLGTTAVGLGRTGSSQGIGVTLHNDGGAATATNGLTLCCSSGVTSSAYHDHDNVLVTDNYAFGTAAHEEWEKLGFTDYVHDGTPVAFNNYIDVPGSKPAVFKRNTCFAHPKPSEGEALAIDETSAYQFKFDERLAEFDTRFKKNLQIRLPNDVVELVW